MNSPTLQVSWGVARVKSHDVELAIDNLSYQGFDSHYPLLRQHAGRLTKLVPMFPGYLFVAMIPGLRWQAINNTRGIIRIMLSAADKPSRLPHGWVDDLRARGDVIDDFNEAFPFEVGDMVEFTEGALAGQRGAVQTTGKDRVSLLLALLGRDTCVIASPMVLKKSSHDSASSAPLR